MPVLETAELTIQERGILATSASAAYLDYFSGANRLLSGTLQQSVLISRTRKYYSRGREFTIEWQDYGQPLPQWFDPLMQGFVQLLTLPHNWDSYGAGPIDLKVVQEAMGVMNGLLSPTSPAPRVVPLSSGGLQLEWRRRGIDLEIVFDCVDEPMFYCRNRETGVESEHTLSESGALLKSTISEIE